MFRRFFLHLVVLFLITHTDALITPAGHACCRRRQRAATTTSSYVVAADTTDRMQNTFPVHHCHQRARTAATSAVTTLLVAVTAAATARAARAADTALLMDETAVMLTGDYLGLGLVVEPYKDDASQIVVASVKNDAPAAARAAVKPGYVLVAVGTTRMATGTTLAQVASALRSAERPVRLVFRDPTKFVNALTLFPGTAAETSVADGEVLRVERVAETNKGAAAMCAAPARLGDVVEVSYSVRTQAGGTLVDGVDAVAPSGAPPSDASFFFVVGSPGAAGGDVGQGAGLPPGWDRYSVVGMCVGERRRAFVPKSLVGGGGGGGGGGKGSGGTGGCCPPPGGG